MSLAVISKRKIIRTRECVDGQFLVQDITFEGAYLVLEALNSVLRRCAKRRTLRKRLRNRKQLQRYD